MADRWELRAARVPEGAHRPKSKGTPGTDRDLWYTDVSNELLGPTESRGVSRKELADILAGQPSSPRAGHQSFEEWLRLLGAAAVVLTPLYVKYIHPAVTKKRAELAERQRTAALNANPHQDAEPEQQPAPVANAEPAIMTGDEFRNLVLLTTTGQAWLEQQRDTLAQAIVVDEHLTPQLRDAINMVLAGNPDQIDTATAGQLATYFNQTLRVRPDRQLLHTDPGPVS